MEYWLNKIRFLFTGKLRIWTVQENCSRDYSDCNDCGAGLYHWASDYLTYAEALDSALDSVKQQLEYSEQEAQEVVINKDDPKHVIITVMVSGVQQQLWYEIIQCEIERSK